MLPYWQTVFVFHYRLYVGNVPTLVISDPEILKQITVKQFAKFTNRVVS